MGQRFAAAERGVCITLPCLMTGRGVWEIEARTGLADPLASLGASC